MEGKNLTRILRVIKSLSIHPSYIPFYLRYSILNKKEPLELALPWISLSAIKFLDNYSIDSKSEILELGGGGSTLYFAKKGAKVTCLESDELWAKKIEVKSKELNISNIDLKILPYNFKKLESFVNSKFFEFIGKNKYDIILIDNYEEKIQLRPKCFYAAEKSIKPGGIIIIDDSWRYPELRENNSAKFFKVFKSIGPCRLGVSSTDIYFY
ncbi:MAG: hypothetical protein HZC46_14370 [Ignavibacterium album]|uniref:hypothetical protein n=1 Tax=Ignavibacterium album TaxID=591197 RepID=UPI0026EC014C|nr:hypothetical protein [Ignavibacterium album]MBI5663319.1 hypothetical protein [Ignavibacterium album]